MPKSRKAFTLVELLVVISIIGVLSSVVFASLSSARASARDTKRKAEIKNMITALRVYYNSNNIFPNISYAGACGTAIDGTDALSVALISDNLMTTMPTIPSNSGACGDAYYSGTWNARQGIAVLTKLEKNDSNCTAWGPSWFTTGSYCNGYYVQVLP